ncbi:poly [ADP-ribose] polymerase 1-like [Contarinia nasturtii]|uniref:poly [ADP-ribose] polymerase 1-like n=1 Tax=Contarinia nasturtii TaxID=265458 RepID=UPI0012D407C3|nr:poly [ADP-ribose] polymerase 1-like [Contarinia nasturtii]
MLGPSSTLGDVSLIPTDTNQTQTRPNDTETNSQHVINQRVNGCEKRLDEMEERLKRVEDGRAITNQPLCNMEFFIVGDTKQPRNVIEHKIRMMGGRLASEIHSRLAAVISNADVVNKGGEDIHPAFLHRIQIISDELVGSFLENDPIELIIGNDLSKFGKDPYERMPEQKDAFKTLRQYETYNTNEISVPNYNVYCENNIRYEAMLNFIDIDINKNSFLKLELIGQTMIETKGRINDISSGFKKQTRHSSVEEGKAAFKNIYAHLTGNEFVKYGFDKQPGKYNRVDILNYTRSIEVNYVNSKLDSSLYNLMKMLFHGDVLEKTLLDYCLVYDGMPLGGIKKRTIRCAIHLLDQIPYMLDVGNSRSIVAFSNQFYSYFPQAFGQRRPPLVNTLEIVQEKIDLLNKVLARYEQYETMTDRKYNRKNLLDVCYEHLQESVEIKILRKSSPMHQQISDYILNTQKQDDPTAHYDPGPCEMIDIFEIERHEETIRYLSHEDNFNRQLLFHGSGMQNFVSILTNGLKVEVNDVYISGSALGKGIYFADTVTKATRYCHPIDGIGLVLLCEVAAGRTGSRYSYDPAPLNTKAFESVQAIGKWHPGSFKTRPNGLKIPNTRIVERIGVKTDLVFNEFVVFDESRVKLKYLVKLKFTGKERYGK